MLSQCLQNQITDGSEFMRIMYRPRFTPQKYFRCFLWYSFLFGAQWNPGPSVDGRIGQIGNKLSTWSCLEPSTSRFVAQRSCDVNTVTENQFLINVMTYISRFVYVRRWLQVNKRNGIHTERPIPNFTDIGLEVSKMAYQDSYDITSASSWLVCHLYRAPSCGSGSHNGSHGSIFMVSV
jgi:hypothetical protein